ncbi:MAG: hypothetical protein QOH32_4870 [Bradyrhizobium sp.]|jgi:hypothetical protein|nr:hypothetical protein [Bradyrhizobium sp.]
MKTAKTFGLTVRSTLLAQADDVRMKSLFPAAHESLARHEADMPGLWLDVWC